MVKLHGITDSGIQRIAAINDDCVSGGDEICASYREDAGYPQCLKSFRVEPFRVWWRSEVEWRDLGPHKETKEYYTVQSVGDRAGECVIGGESDCKDTGCPHWER